MSDQERETAIRVAEAERTAYVRALETAEANLGVAWRAWEYCKERVRYIDNRIIDLKDGAPLEEAGVR